MSDDSKIERIDALLREWAEFMARGGLRSSMNYPAYSQRGVRVDCSTGGGGGAVDDSPLWRVDRAVMALDEPTRTTVGTYYLNNWSPPRVGRAVGCTGRTVLARVYKAHRLIDAWLADRKNC